MTGEPTLHYNDRSADGWVEYLQELLLSAGYEVGVDGIFLNETINAVYAFQKDHHLMVDGVVGNQTWSVLRGADEQPIGTDGHQHQDTDASMHAVFFYELSPHGRTGEYNEMLDTMVFVLAVVGAAPIPSDEYNIWVNFTSDAQMLHSAKVPLSEIGGRPNAEAGDLLYGEVKDVKTLLGGSGHYTYTAEIAIGLGDDTHEGEFTIP